MRRQPWAWIVVAVFAVGAWSAREAAASFCGGRCEDVAKADAIVVATVERVETNVSVDGRADSRIVTSPTSDRSKERRRRLSAPDSGMAIAVTTFEPERVISSSLAAGPLMAVSGPPVPA